MPGSSPFLPIKKWLIKIPFARWMATPFKVKVKVNLSYSYQYVQKAAPTNTTRLLSLPSSLSLYAQGTNKMFGLTKTTVRYRTLGILLRLLTSTLAMQYPATRRVSKLTQKQVQLNSSLTQKFSKKLSQKWRYNVRQRTD